MSIHETIIRKISTAGGRLRVRSALNPILWLCGIVTVPCTIITVQTDDSPVWLAWLAAAPVVAAIIGFLYLLIFDRDKLQSEDYQIRKQSLELIQEKGESFPVNPASIEKISNPELPEPRKALKGDLDP